MAGRLRKGARRLGGFVAGGFKGTLVAGGSGGVGYYANKMANQKVESLQKNTFIMPLLMIAGGHFIKRKAPNVGAGVVGAGGYALAMAFDAKQQADKFKKEQEAAAGKPSDAGALLSPSDIGALLSPSDIGAYDPGDVETSGDDMDMSEALAIGI